MWPIGTFATIQTEDWSQFNFQSQPTWIFKQETNIIYRRLNYFPIFLCGSEILDTKIKFYKPKIRSTSATVRSVRSQIYSHRNTGYDQSMEIEFIPFLPQSLSQVFCPGKVHHRLPPGVGFDLASNLTCEVMTFYLPTRGFPRLPPSHSPRIPRSEDHFSAKWGNPTRVWCVRVCMCECLHVAAWMEWLHRRFVRWGFAVDISDFVIDIYWKTFSALGRRFPGPSKFWRWIYGK